MEIGILTTINNIDGLSAQSHFDAHSLRRVLLFWGDINEPHQEWLGSMITNHDGVVAFVITPVSGRDQLDVFPTHACGGTRSWPPDN